MSRCDLVLVRFANRLKAQALTALAASLASEVLAFRRTRDVLGRTRNSDPAFRRNICHVPARLCLMT